MGSIIDLERIRFAVPQVSPKTRLKAHVPRHQPGEQFLRGPVPLAWLEAAGHLPGKALHIGIDLWFYAGLRHGAAEFPYSVSGAARRFGMGQANASRALAALEQAGLVGVQRAPGRRARVCILAVPVHEVDQHDEGGQHE